MENELELYASILKHWQRKINLISPNTVDIMMERHFENSKILIPYIPENAKSILDMGSGAGFPGMVLGILTKKKTYLVESDTNKSLFLAEVKRQLKLDNVEIINSRIEQINIKSDVITSRALAPLKKLWSYAEPLLNKDGICLFIKGNNVNEEINNLPKNFNNILLKYETKSESVVILIKKESRET